MARTAVITQPTYLPWLGYFEQMAQADVFVFLDTAQFVQRSWHSRNRLRGPNGQPFWLSVPIAKHSQKTPIAEIRISNETPWAEKHLRSIQSALGKAPYFGEIFPHVESWLKTEHDLLCDLTISGIRMFAKLLCVECEMLRASSLDVGGSRVERLAGICRKLEADRYYSAAGASDYMAGELEPFESAGISVVFQCWEHPEYEQGGDGFLSHLAVLDPLCHVGPDACRRFLVAPTP